MSDAQFAERAAPTECTGPTALHPPAGNGLVQDQRLDAPSAAADAIAEAELAEAPADRPPPVESPWRERLWALAAVSVGGMLGANARYVVGLWAAERWGDGLPWGTLLINLSGSYLLGFYLTLVTERFAGRSLTRLFVATGFLGAFTTFATFSYEAVHLLARGEIGWALAYVFASVLLGLIGALAGALSAHAL